MPRFSLVPSVLLLVTPVLCFPAAPAQAQFTYISQTRTVYAATFWPAGGPMDAEQTWSAADFAPFDREARAGTGLPTRAFASMTQQSRLDPLEMASVASSDVTPRSGRSVVQSVCDIEFSLSTPATVRFYVYMIVGTHIQHETSIRNSSGTILLSSTTQNTDQTVVLSAGLYHWRQTFFEDTLILGSSFVDSRLSVVPAPGALFWLGFSVVAMSRRRNRPTAGRGTVPIAAASEGAAKPGSAPASLCLAPFARPRR